MRKYPLFLWVSMILSGLLLTSCEKKDTAHHHVSQFVKSLEQAASTQTQKSATKDGEMLPVAYDGESYRDPFELPASVKNVKQYPNTILHDMALDSLKLIGIVHHKDRRWAIFRASNGKLYKITEGMRVGTQQALLTDIKRDQVTFVVDAVAEGEKSRELVMSVQEPK